MENTIETPAKSEVSTVDYSALPELKAGTPMERLTFKEFRQLHSIKSVEKFVNENSNGYFFISFYTDNGKCHNIYFAGSDNTQAIVEELDIEKGTEVNRELINSFKFAWTLTPSANVVDSTGKLVSEGYTWKLVSPKEGGNRLEASDLD